MFDYLQQFNKLPKDLRNKISQKELMSKVNELEKKYQVALAALIMKVMVKQVPYNNIALYLVGEKDLDEHKAEELSKKLKETVFKDVNDYLDSDKNKQEYNDNKEGNSSKLVTEDKKENKKEDPQELINQITKKEDHNIKIDTATKDIIDKADVSLSSAYLHDRLHMVLRIYIKGVRDKIATRSVLTRPGQEGGLSLDDASIDKLLKLADEYKNSQELKIEKPKAKPGEEAERRDKLEALNENYSLKDSLKSKEKEEDKKEEDKKEDLYKKLHIQREIAPPSPSTVVNKEEESIDSHKTDKHKKEDEMHSENKVSEIKDNEKSDNEKQTAEIEEAKANEENRENREDREKKEDIGVEGDKKDQDKETQKQRDKQRQVDDKKKSLEVNDAKQKEISSDLKNSPQETKSSYPSNLSQAPVSSGKKSMQDIKVNQRIMGPIDELRYFNLKNFRRLSSDPQEAFSKIKEKIELLTKESYEKRLEGIQAWRENPLNKLYYQISRESLDQSKPISEVIKQRQENNVDYLSSEELKVLVSFNRSYMF
jgi:hypothetical protein